MIAETLDYTTISILLTCYKKKKNLPHVHWLGWIWMHEAPFCGKFHDSHMHFIVFHTLFSILPPADSHKRHPRQQRLCRLLQLTAQILLAPTSSFLPTACDVQWRIIYYSFSSLLLICAQLSFSNDAHAVPSESSGYSIVPETKYANHIKRLVIELDHLTLHSS